jgi:hypothetical protein
MRLGIVELHNLDTTEIVVVACILWVTRAGWEISLGNEFVCLVKETIVDVVVEEAINESSLGLVIVPQRGGALSRKQESEN